MDERDGFRIFCLERIGSWPFRIAFRGVGKFKLSYRFTILLTYFFQLWIIPRFLNIFELWLQEDNVSFTYKEIIKGYFTTLLI